MPPGGVGRGGALHTECPVGFGRVVWGLGRPLYTWLWVTRGPCRFTTPAPDLEGDCYPLRGPGCTLT